MNSDKAIQKKIENYLVIPLLASLLLVVMCGLLFLLDTNIALIVSGGCAVFIAILIILFAVTKRSFLPAMMSFALEQGQIQRELLRELSVPYALLDVDGRILWENKLFKEQIDDGKKRLPRKNIFHLFPMLDEETLLEKPEQMVSLVYEGREYDAQIKTLSFDEAYADEKDLKSATGEALIALYLFDVTEINQYKRENEDQKMVSGLLYIDNYDEVMESTEEVRHSLVEALVDRRISIYLTTIDAIGKKMEKAKVKAARAQGKEV